MRSRRKRRYAAAIGIALAVILAAAALTIILFRLKQEPEDKTLKPDQLLLQYMACIETGRYEEMYGMLSPQSKVNMTLEDFTNRNKNIYEGIEASQIAVEVTGVEDSGKTDKIVSYTSSMNTIAGEIRFTHQALFTQDEEKNYLLEWNDRMIFPQLEITDKVRVSTDQAVRGQIVDRNGLLLAGPGTASSVGLVPGKMSEAPEGDLEKLSELLGVSKESISKKLEAKWVKEDSFVPVKTIKKVEETALLTETPDEEALRITALKEELLTIPGVKISDTEVRGYPLGKAASHLTGYVQNVTAEDLEKHKGEGYRSDSVIGRSGMEGLYEKELKGRDGHTIRIVTAQGGEKAVLASVPKEDGKTIRLTIDAKLQTDLYERFKEDKSCSVALNPYTGEVLALVSTPSFDSNDFILGLSESQWNELNEDPARPMYNRFRQRFCPGSSFKPVTAGIGLTTGDIDPFEDYGKEGLSWQKDSSWGNYHVTTLHTYEPVVLQNALIYSDNIYFAKAALKIGGEKLASSLDQLGFNEPAPFEITMAKSQYSNEGGIENEIQLADSGYGQGQILVNPLHLACLYTAFDNQGSVVKPYLLYTEEPKKEIWIEQAFSAEAANAVKNALIQAVNSPEGTGYGAHMENMPLAGKTGTAEIKASKEDTAGTELGWFGIFTTEENAKDPFLIMSMVEDVKGRGGSGYVVKKIKNVLDLR